MECINNLLENPVEQKEKIEKAIKYIVKSKQFKKSLFLNNLRNKDFLIVKSIPRLLKGKFLAGGR